MASIKDLERMCRSYVECNGCPLFIEGVARCKPFEFPDNVEEVVDKWEAEHPVKTYAMDFFEKFSNASRDRNGEPKICWNYVYGDGKFCFSKDCTECWNKEMIENDN